VCGFFGSFTRYPESQNLNLKAPDAGFCGKYGSFTWYLWSDPENGCHIHNADERHDIGIEPRIDAIVKVDTKR